MTYTQMCVQNICYMKQELDFKHVAFRIILESNVTKCILSVVYQNESDTLYNIYIYIYHSHNVHIYIYIFNVLHANIDVVYCLLRNHDALSIVNRT